MRLENGELTIRTACQADAETLAGWWNDGRVMAHAGFPRGLGTTADEVRRQIAVGAEHEKGGLLVVGHCGRSIGEMSWRDAGGGAAEIGIKICEEAEQGRGYGRVLLCMLIEELFRRGYVAIVLDTNLKNVRAQHVYETLGFTRVRVNENAWADQLGEMQASVEYRLEKGALRDFAGQRRDLSKR